MAGRSTSSGWSIGGATFAACMMILLGIWQVLIGIAAVARGTYFVTGTNYIYSFNIHGWGWAHIAIGALSVIAGFFIFTGAMWARAVGIFMAALSATAQFFWMPYQPIWAVVVLALDIFVIWALMTMGSAMDEEVEADRHAAAELREQRDWEATNRTRRTAYDTQNPPAATPPSEAPTGSVPGREEPPRH